MFTAHQRPSLRLVHPHIITSLPLSASCESERGKRLSPREATSAVGTGGLTSVPLQTTTVLLLESRL